MEGPTKYNKKYFMACAVFWYLEACYDRYGDDEMNEALDEIGIPDKYRNKIREMVEEEDFLT